MQPWKSRISSAERVIDYVLYPYYLFRKNLDTEFSLKGYWKTRSLNCLNKTIISNEVLAEQIIKWLGENIACC